MCSINHLVINPRKSITLQINQTEIYTFRNRAQPDLFNRESCELITLIKRQAVAYEER